MVTAAASASQLIRMDGNWSVDVSPTLRVQLLGDFYLVYDHQPVSKLDSPRLQSLLAYLLLHRNAPQARQHVAFLFWPDSTESQARNNLRQALYLLRHALPDADRFLCLEPHAMQWLPDSPFALDVADFERAAEQAQSLESLRHAVNLYHGDLLPGCYDDWIVPERERLQQEFRLALEHLILFLENQGDYRSAVRCAERLLRSDPLREEAHRQLIRLYALSGDRTGAMRVYQTCVKILRRELDVEPSPETRAVYAESQKKQASPARPARRPTPQTGNLPTYLTSFIGRREELNHLKGILLPPGAPESATRLLTLTGAGGCGKTRLAIQAASCLADSFAGGVWFVDVATLTDPALIPQAIVSAFGIHERPGRDPLEGIADHLRAKESLLVLDSCECWLVACARIVESLLHACPRLQIVATSRQKLSVAGERVLPVSPLSLPDGDSLSPDALLRSDAIRLFVDRACSSWPTFALGADNVVPILQICQRLDGLPLAIELAAARVGPLAPIQIAARLDKAFQLLSSVSPSTPPRHHTLRATLDWSYQSLTKPERVLFQRLSVFAGSFALEAVEVVCADQEEGASLLTSEILDPFSALVDKSLVVVSDWKQGDELRYRLLQPTWQYGNEKLMASDDMERVRQRHLEFFLNLAEEAEHHFIHVEQVAWFDRLMAEHDNLMAALDWSLARSGLTEALRLTGALWYFWLARGYYAAGVKRLMQAISLTQTAAPSRARAKALWAAGAIFLWSTSDWSRARPLLEESLAVGRGLGDKSIISGALDTLGATAYGQGDFVAARSFLAESLALLRELDDKHSLGWSLAYLGDLALLEQDQEQAQRLYVEGMASFRQIGDINSMAYPVRRLGMMALERGDYEQAQTLFKESLMLNKEVGYLKGIAACLEALAGVALRQGQLVRAARLFGAGEAALEAFGGKLFPTDQAGHEHHLTALRTQLEESSLDAAWAEGKAMRADQAMDYALKAEEH
jgi:predicted ATPase/DNA-binding SARP family transcriptional activator